MPVQIQPGPVQPVGYQWEERPGDRTQREQSCRKPEKAQLYVQRQLHKLPLLERGETKIGYSLMEAAMAAAGKRKMRVEVTEETLNRLLSAGQACAAEFRCLDCKSKECLWHLCLISCTNNLKPAVEDGSTMNCVNQMNSPCRKSRCGSSKNIF